MIDGYNNDLNKQGAPHPTLTPVGQFKPDGATFTATLEPIPLFRDALFWQGLGLVGLAALHVAILPPGVSTAAAIAGVVQALGASVGPLFGVALPPPEAPPHVGLLPAMAPIAAYAVKQARADIQHGVPSLAGRLFARRPSGCLWLAPATQWFSAFLAFVAVSCAIILSGCTVRLAGLEGAVAKIATGHGGFCTKAVGARVRAYNPDAEYVVDCPTECPATMTAFTVVTAPVCTVYEAK